MRLRPYQLAAADDVLARFAAGQRAVCLVLPTGGGKTHTAAFIVRALVAQGKRVLWAAHRLELVQQAMASMGVPCGWVVSGRPSFEIPSVVVTMVQTASRRGLRGKYDVVVVDEAHHIASASYQRLMEHAQGAKLLGLTATPTRLDGKPLGKYFESAVIGAHVSALMQAGHLVKPRVFTTPVEPDMQGVKKTGGDYNEAQLELAVNKQVLRGDILRHWRERSSDRPSVLFAVSVEHSKALVADFAGAGVRAVHVDGAMPRVRRTEALQSVRAGHARVLCNVGIVTEGYDDPALETCILARPTASLSLLCQMMGRVLRPASGKPGALILDHAGNLVRHEVLPWTDIDWEAKMRGEKKEKPPPLKTCPACFAVMSGFEQACPACGHIFEPKTREAGERQGPEYRPDEQLIEITDADKQLVLHWRERAGSRPASYIQQLTERFERGAAPPEFTPYVRAAGGSIGIAVNRFKADHGRAP